MKTTSLHSLMLAIKRCEKYESPGILSRLLLQAFCENKGIIRSDDWTEELSLRKHSFTSLRQQLKCDEFITWDDGVKKCRYQPGRRLLKYINNHLIECQQIATLKDLECVSKKQDKNSDEINRMKKKLEDSARRQAETEARLARIEVIAVELQQVMGPPDTPHRRNERLRLTSAIKQAISVRQ